METKEEYMRKNAGAGKSASFHAHISSVSNMVSISQSYHTIVIHDGFDWITGKRIDKRANGLDQRLNRLR